MSRQKGDIMANNSEYDLRDAETRIKDEYLHRLPQELADLIRFVFSNKDEMCLRNEYKLTDTDIEKWLDQNGYYYSSEDDETRQTAD